MNILNNKKKNNRRTSVTYKNEAKVLLFRKRLDFLNLQVLF